MKNEINLINRPTTIYSKRNIRDEGFEEYTLSKDEELRIEVGPKEEVKIIVFKI
jgi:hypothetical protein